MNDAPVDNVFDAYLAKPPTRNWIARFIEGASSPWMGFKFMRRHPNLWQYAALPFLMNLLITSLVFFVLLMVANWFIYTVHPWFTGDREGFFWFLAFAIEIIAAVALFITCAVISIVTWRILTGILCGYFYGILAKHVEMELGLDESELKEVSFLHGIIDTILDLMMLVVVTGCCLLMNLIPIVGSILSLIISTTISLLILGTDYLSFPLSMRGVRRTAQFGFARRNGTQTMGLGSTVFLFGFVPILGAIFLTTAAVGAVLLHRRLAQGTLEQKAKATPDAEPLIEKA